MELDGFIIYSVMSPAGLGIQGLCSVSLCVNTTQPRLRLKRWKFNCRSGRKTLASTSSISILRDILNCKQNDLLRQRTVVLIRFKFLAFTFKINNLDANIFVTAICILYVLTKGKSVDLFKCCKIKHILWNIT